MTDVNEPNIVKAIATMTVRHAITGMGAALAAKGIIDGDNAGAFNDLVTGGVLALAGLAWGAVSKIAAKSRWLDALYAKPPAPVRR